MDITSRAQWGARAPRKLSEVVIDSWSVKTEFFVHYSFGSADQSMQSLQNYFMDSRGYNDIGYSFVVHPVTGQIWEGRGWLVRGGHTYGHNKPGIGVCVLGKGPASQAARRSVRWLWEESQRRAGQHLRQLGHKDVVNTSCPGTELYTWTHAGMPVDTDPGTTPNNWTERIVNTLPDVKRGSTGLAAKTAQALLNRDLKGEPLQLDGVFGPKSEEVLKAWQVAFKVPNSVKSDGTGDGVFGQSCWTFTLTV